MPMPVKVGAEYFGQRSFGKSKNDEKPKLGMPPAKKKLVAVMPQDPVSNPIMGIEPKKTGNEKMMSMTGSMDKSDPLHNLSALGGPSQDMLRQLIQMLTGGKR